MAESDYVVVHREVEKGWAEFEFADLCDITRGASPRPIHEWISDQGIPWLKISDASATESRYIVRTRERIRSEGVAKSVPVFPGDLILSNSATPGIPKFVDIEACIHDGWLLLRNLRHVDKLFCYYLLLYERPRIVEQGSGTVFTNLKTDILKRHRVQVPPLPEQRAIAHILGTLDDKIELNRRMNQTLEEMARAIFKDWFIDFDPTRAKMEGREPYLPPEVWDLFPDSLVDSEFGPIPDGWVLKPIGDLMELAYGKALRAANRNPGDIPVYGSNGRIDWHDQSLVAGPGIVVGRKGNPGVVTWVQTDFFPIDTTFYVVPRDDDINLLFWLHALEIQDLPSIAADSAVPGLNRNLAYMNSQLVPDKTLLDEFGRFARDLFKRRHQLEEESRSLARQRDALLPRLMSGEMKVVDLSW